VSARHDEDLVRRRFGVRSGETIVQAAQRLRSPEHLRALVQEGIAAEVILRDGDTYDQGRGGLARAARVLLGSAK
jgi:hypothetical protein